MNFFSFFLMGFSGSPKGTPMTGVVELWKKNYFAVKTMEIGCVPEKIDEYFPWDLYSMYVVLQGIESPPCIRVYL